MNHVLIAPLLVSVAASLLSAQEVPGKPSPATAGVESHMRGATRCKASDLIGCAITNSKNDSLGEIEDIVLDSSNRNIAYAVVSFGGFLGMGDKYFALPWRLIEVSQRGVNDKPRATLGLDQETLKTAPGFDKSKWPDMANPTWAKQVDDYYRAHNEMPLPGGGAAEPKGSGAGGKSGVERAPGSPAFVHRRLSKLIGMGVVDAQYKSLADVEDLIVDTRFAMIDAALLSFGGTLGIGESVALVPAEAMTIDIAKNVFVFPCTKANLEAMALPGGKLPALNNEDWLTRCREMCVKARLALGAVGGDAIAVEAAAAKPTQFLDTYDLKTVKTVKGTIQTVGSVLCGDLKEERVRLRVRATDDGREVIVFAAPASFEEQQALGLRSGKVIEVTGSPARYGNQTVLVAGTITVDGKIATLRDDQGHAVWIKK